MVRMGTIGDTEGSVQEGLFADVGSAPEPILMALHAEYYDLIWNGEKIHEFRKRFLKGTPARWFVYLNAPVSRLAAVIDLAPAVVDVPERIAEIAERTRRGNGASVFDYVRGLEEAFAIPILAVREYAGLTLADLRAELGAFHPPQGYLRLNNNPELLALVEKMATDVPIREKTMHHR
jgi:predicted transcriptional regulator